VFVAIAVWEACAPRRCLAVGRGRRWPHNLGILVLDAALVRVIFPTAAVGIAAIAAAHGWGLLNLVGLSGWSSVMLSVVLLDLALYGQHVVFHVAGPLWRLHRMHHADLDFDVTTGVRFHPLEILLSLAIKIAVILVIGAPVLGVLIFEVLLNATSMFNHGNVRIPRGFEHALRWFVVTPEMHRVHHSIVRAETDSNVGFNLPWWDWLFGTYRSHPEAGQDAMTIGIPQFRDPAELRIDRLLTQPFRDE